MRATAVLTLACAILPGAASATPRSELAAVDARLKTCIDKDASDFGMKTCVGDAYQAADKVLNDVYNAAVANLRTASKQASDTNDRAERLKRLVTSERAWIGYRDADCALRGADMLGGTGEGLVIVDCRFSMTKARAIALDDVFSDK